MDAESRWGSYGDKLVKPTFGLGTICEARSIEVYGGVAGSVHNDMAWHDDPRCQTAVCRPTLASNCPKRPAPQVSSEGHLAGRSLARHRPMLNNLIALKRSGPLNLNETHPTCGWRVHSRLALKVSSIRSTMGSKSARSAVG